MATALVNLLKLAKKTAARLVDLLLMDNRYGSRTNERHGSACLFQGIATGARRAAAVAGCTIFAHV